MNHRFMIQHMFVYKYVGMLVTQPIYIYIYIYRGYCVGSYDILYHNPNLTFLPLKMNVAIVNENSVRRALSSVSRQLLRSDLTWGKIISLFCVVGGLAVDCVYDDNPRYITGLTEAMAVAVERDAAMWIVQQGGWVILFG